MSIVEIIAVVFSLLCVYQTMKNNIWCWFTGLIGVLAYAFVFWEVKLYSDVILQVIYVFMQFAGWYQWMYGSKNKDKLPITDLTGTRCLQWLGVILIGTGLWGQFMAMNTDAACPHFDAFIVVTSLVAQWLLCVKKVQAWIAWIMVDVIAIGVYAYKDLNLTAVLYAVFLCMAIKGYYEWKKLKGTVQ